LSQERFLGSDRRIKGYEPEEGGRRRDGVPILNHWLSN
jgi:hypothetical protein